MSLAKALTDAVVRRLGGEDAYRRGADYFAHGHVKSLEHSKAGVQAVVRGAKDYEVTLAADDGMLDYVCDCPQGSDGVFCKHCVAVSLAWLSGAAKSRRAPRKAREVKLADAEKILLEESKETLVRMMIEWAKNDSRLREELVLYAARRSGPESSAAEVARAFQKAVRVRGFVEYREAGGWARGVNRAIDAIAQLLADGQPGAVVEICEEALRSLSAAMGSIDDSAGHCSILRDRLEELHFQACTEAKPDPVELARRIFEMELNNGFDILYGAVEKYAGILGEEGMRTYRKLADQEWEKVPVRTAKKSRSGGSDYFRITHIMESLAQASGSVDDLVAVLSRDLTGAFQYRRIAETYRDAGRHDQVLEWAEKGLAAFPEHGDTQLRAIAAEEYHRRGRHEDAMKLMWAEFTGRMHLQSYTQLEKHAKLYGKWPQWRERALEEIRARITKGREEGRFESPAFRWLQPRQDNSLLVEIRLYEGAEEDAWNEASAGGCSTALWLRLAETREREHPEDAAAVYWRVAEKQLETIRDGRYEETVELLVKAAALRRRVGRGAEFGTRLDKLRLDYKAKRNFQKEVEARRTLLYGQ